MSIHIKSTVSGSLDSIYQTKYSEGSLLGTYLITFMFTFPLLPYSPILPPMQGFH